MPASKRFHVRFIPMRRIIYISKSLTGSDPAELDDILEVSNARNSEAGITGILWFDGANFAQVIEGNHVEVGAAMNRIRADSRHADIETVSDCDVTARQFGTWAMRRADGGEESTMGTMFLIGHAISESTDASKRLYDIILATEKQIQ